ncbi:hypothetical protein ACLM5J_11855 [Nocardioides sp. Bht2]|uniref:hypothetical protein n=1 Tax=Nocardioides sp. Bht2 TaxID=3392297 RepID=UPI0039B40A42
MRVPLTFAIALGATLLVGCATGTETTARDPQPEAPAAPSALGFEMTGNEAAPLDYSSPGLPYDSVSVLVVRGARPRQVAKILGADLSRTVHPDEVDLLPEERTVWSFRRIDGGVLAVELTGYGDPTRSALAKLSAIGGSAAVVRDDIDAITRFAAATDGALVFDGDEYAFVDDPALYPDHLRSIASRAWVDLSKPLTDTEEDPFTVGLELITAHTGLTFGMAEIESTAERSGFSAPTLVYITE